MDRFLVPRLGFVVVIGLATLLIGVIVRSPNTRGNLWSEVPPDYTRTEIAGVGGQGAGEGPQTGGAPHRPAVALALPQVTFGAAEPMDPGRRAYIQAGCATCHGVDARGGPVGPSLAASHPEIVKRMVRDGPGGMPAYSATSLSDADLDKLAGYLQSLTVVRPSSAGITAIQGLTWDPSIPPGVLLQGKAALRRSCGGCHSQPTNEEIRSAFANDFDATSLVAAMVVRQTTLSLEDARAIAYYMMAVLHGADPVKAP